VGASRRVEDVRAAKFSRENDDYKKVLMDLSEKGLTPFYKIIWDNIEDDCVGAYEKMRISYQRALLGKKLTNIAKGGDGFNIDWNDELRLKVSKINKLIASSPEGRQQRSEIMTNFFSSDENRQKQSEILINYYQTDEGKQTIERMKISDRESLLKFAATEEGKISYYERGLKLKETKNSIDWLRNNEDFSKKISSSLEEYAQTDEGKEDYKKRGNKIKKSVSAYFQTLEGRTQAMLHAWWLSNVQTRNYWGA
jgi:hypothetical protein